MTHSAPGRLASASLISVLAREDDRGREELNV